MIYEPIKNNQYSDAFNGRFAIENLQFMSFKILNEIQGQSRYQFFISAFIKLYQLIIIIIHIKKLIATVSFY